MEPISDENKARLNELQSQMDALKKQLSTLTEQVDAIVPKHTFEECRTARCIHTHRCRFYCQKHLYCVRSKWSHGVTTDYFQRKQPTIKENIEYPTLGWGHATSRGMFFKNAWHGSHAVVKETEKTLVLDDKTVLLKSTIFHIEDCTYIRNRSNQIYFCADSPEVRDGHLMMLNVIDDEMSERMGGLTSIKL